MSLLQIDFQIPLYKYIYVCMHEYMCTVYIYSDPSCPHPSCLQSSYPHPRCVPSLENAIKEVDAAYDSCNEAWAQGEADKFRSVKFLTQFVVLGRRCSGCVNKVHKTNEREFILTWMQSIDLPWTIFEVCGHGRGAHAERYFHVLTSTTANIA